MGPWPTLALGLLVWECAGVSASAVDCGIGEIVVVQGATVYRWEGQRGTNETAIDADSLPALVGGDQHKWAVGQSLETEKTSRVTVLFPGCGTTVILGPASRATLKGARADAALHLRLELGQAEVWGSAALAGWTLITFDEKSYVASRGVIRASLPESVELLRGEAGFYRGAVPQGGLLGPDGRLSAAPDLILAPKTESLQASLAQHFQNLRDEAWAEANRWVLDAAQGDLIPSRGVETGPSAFVLETAQRQPSFDRPRLAVQISPTGATVRGPTTGTSQRSIVDVLAGQGDPGNVAVASRIERTRIVGAGFTGASLGGLSLFPQVNPFVQPIRLNTGQKAR